MKESGTAETEEIKKVVTDYLGEYIPPKDMQSLTDSTALMTGGFLDSITLVELVSSLEDHFGINFQSHEMSVDYFNTRSDIVKIVQSKIDAQS